MNAIFKILIVVAIIVASLALIGQIIPDPLASVNPYIIQFYVSLAPLGLLFHIDTLYNIIKLSNDLIAGFGAFLIIWVIAHFTAK